MQCKVYISMIRPLSDFGPMLRANLLTLLAQPVRLGPKIIFNFWTHIVPFNMGIESIKEWTDAKKHCWFYERVFHEANFLIYR